MAKIWVVYAGEYDDFHMEYCSVDKKKAKHVFDKLKQASKQAILDNFDDDKTLSQYDGAIFWSCALPRYRPIYEGDWEYLEGQFVDVNLDMNGRDHTTENYMYISCIADNKEEARIILEEKIRELSGK